MTKICKDCKHYKYLIERSTHTDWYTVARDVCLKTAIPDVVTGIPSYHSCEDERTIHDCGSEGQHFEPKQPSLAQTIVNFFKRK